MPVNAIVKFCEIARIYVVSSRIEEFEDSLDPSRKPPRSARAGPWGARGAGHQVRSEVWSKKQII